MAPHCNGHHSCTLDLQQWGPLVSMDIPGCKCQTFKEVLMAILCTPWRPLTQSHMTLLGGSLKGVKISKISSQFSLMLLTGWEDPMTALRILAKMWIPHSSLM